MYRIEIHTKCKLNASWLDWFGELEVQNSLYDETILRGILPDMAAFYGIVSRLGSLVVPLISVTCYEESESG